MISVQQEMEINNLISCENSREIIRNIIETYSKESANNCQFLLNLIPDIANRSIHILEKERMEKSQAIFMMMFERTAEIKGNEEAYFASMIPVCKTHFPEGNAKRCSQAEKDYFNLFCKLFKNKKAFSWKRDKEWANAYGYSDYLRLVEKQMNGEEN